jgi:hypothetical protein
MAATIFGSLASLLASVRMVFGFAVWQLYDFSVGLRVREAAGDVFDEGLLLVCEAVHGLTPGLALHW